MVGQVAMKKPEAVGVSNHVGGFRSQRQQKERVPASAVGEHRVAVPMRGVEIERAYVTHIQEIPTYALALLHGHHRPVAVEVSIDGKLVVGLGESGAREREASLRIGVVVGPLTNRFLVGGA